MRHLCIETLFEEDIIYLLSRKLTIKYETDEKHTVLASTYYQNRFKENFLENLEQEVLSTKNKRILIYLFDLNSVLSYPCVEEVKDINLDRIIIQPMNERMLLENQHFSLPKDTYLIFSVEKRNNIFYVKLHSLSSWLNNEYLNYLATGEINYLSY